MSSALGFSASKARRPSAIHESITQTICNTPIVKLGKLSPPGVNVFCKLEAANPGGSVKDRLALGMIEWAERNDLLKPGQTVVEASSGNTGIGLATVCAARGYPLVVVMSESFSIERRKLMRFLGAKVVLTNPAHKGTGMVIKAKELADQHGWYWPDQFTNEANAWIHSITTGPEIVDAFKAEGKELDHFFTAYGTGGTLKGVGEFLRSNSPGTKIHVCEPNNAPMLYSEIKTAYPPDEKPAKSFEVAHPVWRPHLLQGWAADFIPMLVSKAVDTGYVDQLHHTDGKKAMQVAKDLATKEGIFSGTSGGGVLSSALEFAATLPEGSNVLAMIPDTGERYLSTPLFDDVPADMTEEEKAIAESTPSTPPPPPGLPDVTPEAVAFVDAKCKEKKVLMWSLQYCEFCWTLSKLLDKLGVSYEVIKIDSFDYAKDNMGNKYRAALSDKTKCTTFPQFFVDDKFIGGAADACIMWKKGELQTLFKDAGVEFSDDYDGDPFEFLPKWMTKNPLRSR